MSRIKAYELYRDTLDLINEDQRGQLRIDQFNRFANVAQRWLVDYMTGRFSDQPAQKIELGKIQKSTDYLKPILHYRIIPLKNSVAPYPENYDHYLDLRISHTNHEERDCTDDPRFSIEQILSGAAGFDGVDVLKHDQIPRRINTRIPELKKRKCAEQFDDGFKIYPFMESGSAFLAYVSEPPAMKLAMTIDPATNALVPDIPNTIDPVFDQKSANVLARKIAQLFFNWTREPGAIESSDAISKTE